MEETAQEAQERPQEREKEVREDDNTQEAENRQETPQEQPQVVYVERQTEKQHGCAFCHPQHHREVSTAEGGFLLAYEPEGHTVQVINKETGIVESIVFHCCPMCGRKLV